MNLKSFAALFCLPVLATALFAQTSESMKPYTGTWKGTCADGKVFVVLTLNLEDSGVAGTISLGNFKGEEGQCATVTNPPSEAHAMKVSEPKLRDTVLSFKGRGGAEFEMTLAGPETARLKFLGTAVIDSPWVLKKSK